MNEDKSPRVLLKTLALLDELESRDPYLGFENLRLYIMSDLVQREKSYLEDFESLAADFMLPIITYRFTN